MNDSPTAPRSRTLLDRFFGYDYFIAHRSVDGKTYARELHQKLTGLATPFRCFIDHHDYALGGDLSRMQTVALRKATRLIVVVTPGAHVPPSEGQDWLLNEIREFKARRDPRSTIVPIGTRNLLDPALWPGSPILKEIPHWPNGNCILETDPTRLEQAPSEETIARLVLDFTERRQERARLHVFQTLSAILGLLLIATVTLGVVAYFARERAARNEQRARQSKAAAEGIMDDMLRDLGHKLKAIGKLELLENVTTAAENYFARMDPALRDAQTETHAALSAMTSGDILRQKGDHTAARVQYAKAEAQLTQLTVSVPADARLWRDLGNARNNLALVAQLADDPPAEAVWLDQATTALSEAMRLDPTNFDYRRELILMRIRRLDNSATIEECDALVADAQQLLTDRPNATNARLLSFASTVVADAHERRGELEKAAERLNRATMLMFDIEKLLPEDAEVQLDLVGCLQALAFLQKKQGREQESLAAIDAAETTAASLRQRDALNQEWLGHHAQVLSISADLHFRAGKTELALAKARNSTSLLRRVQERHPATRKHARDAALALATFGHQLAKANKWSEAASTWSASSELLEKLSANGGLTPEQEVDLAVVQRMLAETSLAADPPDIHAARGSLAKAITRLKDLQGRGKLPKVVTQFIAAWETRDRELKEL